MKEECFLRCLEFWVSTVASFCCNHQSDFPWIAHFIAHKFVSFHCLTLNLLFVLHKCISPMYKYQIIRVIENIIREFGNYLDEI